MSPLDCISCLGFLLIIFSTRGALGYNPSFNCENTICNPQAGDLLVGREAQISATSTCGLKQVENYCVYTPTKSNECRECYSAQPYNELTNPESHTIDNVIFRNPPDFNRWWQSKSGEQNVSIQVNLENQFQLMSTMIKFKTYRPAAMLIERSSDFGRTWEKYQYFAANCKKYFPAIPHVPRTRLIDVVCTEEYSGITPSENGTVSYVVAPTEIRDPTYKQYNRTIFHNYLAVTTLRVTFVRLHSLGDFDIERNPLIERKYYYALYEWNVMGQCSCYGHADSCRPKNPYERRKVAKVYGTCNCKHNTAGDNSEVCKDFHNDAPWRPATENEPNVCRMCNCHGHSDECSFMEFSWDSEKSGTHCHKCKHNTFGRQCGQCADGYFRNPNVPITDPNTCLKCTCLGGAVKQKSDSCVQYDNAETKEKAGQCLCKDNMHGINCEECKPGFYSYDATSEKGCKPCDCLTIGTVGNLGCDKITGQCVCKRNVVGTRCSECSIGHFNLTDSMQGCQECLCSKRGSIPDRPCDSQTGECLCKEHYMGRDCSKLEEGFFEEQIPGRISENGTIEVITDGPKNDTSRNTVIIIFDAVNFRPEDPWYVKMTIEQPWENCREYLQNGNPEFSTELRVEQDQQTKNKIIIENVCLESNKPIKIIITPERKGQGELVYNDIILIPIKEATEIVDPKTCEPYREYWDIPEKREQVPSFCIEYFSSGSSSQVVVSKCECNPTGSNSSSCDRRTGQCLCYPGVEGRKCDRCMRGYYGFSSTGCTACNCDWQGSSDQQCDEKGQCPCRPRIEGRKCDECPKGTWLFPRCMPCECNGLADSCNITTGECIKCRQNTGGYNCERCAVGYYGDPQTGVQCLQCACPTLDVNHANTCSFDEMTRDIKCQCLPGYTGKNCDKCDHNYWGDAKAPGPDACKKCDCNGNERNDKRACDPVTGHCEGCQYNTMGRKCEKCAKGFYGNATTRNCQQCKCNLLGVDPKATDVCHPETGECACLPTVKGARCFECEDNMFNMTYGIGCEPCACDITGSESTSCDKYTGKCSCLANRSGRRCDECERGFFGDPKKPNGCQRCKCNSMGAMDLYNCDSKTGQCLCREGITGQMCDKCKRGTEGEAPDCKPCGQCWTDWDAEIELTNSTIRNTPPSALSLELDFDTRSVQGYLEIMESLDMFNLDMDEVTNLKASMLQLKTEIQATELKFFSKDDLTESNHQTQLDQRKKLNELRALSRKLRDHYKKLVFQRDQSLIKLSSGSKWLLEDLNQRLDEDQRFLLEFSKARQNYQNDVNMNEDQYKTFKEFLDKTNLDKVTFQDNIKQFNQMLKEMNKKMCGLGDGMLLDSAPYCNEDCGGVGCSGTDEELAKVTRTLSDSNLESREIIYHWRQMRSHYHPVSKEPQSLLSMLSPDRLVGYIGACSPANTNAKCGKDNFERRFRVLLPQVHYMNDAFIQSYGPIFIASDKLAALQNTRNQIEAQTEQAAGKATMLQQSLQSANQKAQDKLPGALKEIEKNKGFTLTNYNAMEALILGMALNVSKEDAQMVGDDLLRKGQESNGLSSEADSWLASMRYEQRMREFNNSLKLLKGDTDNRAQQMENFQQATRLLEEAKQKPLIKGDTTAQFKTEYEQFKNKVDSLHSKYENVQNEAKKTLDLVSSLRINVTDLLQNVEGASQTSRNNLARAGNMNQKVKELKSVMKSIENKIKNVQPGSSSGIIGPWVAQAEEFNKQVGDQLSDVEKMNSDLDRKRDDLDQLRKDMAILQGEISTTVDLLTKRAKRARFCSERF